MEIPGFEREFERERRRQARARLELDKERTRRSGHRIEKGVVRQSREVSQWRFYVRQ